MGIYIFIQNGKFLFYFLFFNNKVAGLHNIDLINLK